MKYPKIETLYKRDEETFRVVDGALRLPEFGLVDRWLVTEKIDGTNVRVLFEVGGEIRFGGRTDNAQMPAHLLKALEASFTPDAIAAAFEPETRGILYGEGYGAKIQKGGGNYRADASFRLFDVLIQGERDWWLNWEGVEDIASKLGIETVPVLGRNETTETAVEWLRNYSQVASAEADNEVQQEGIVARTNPLLFTRSGQRVMWKLKDKDFTGGKHSPLRPPYVLGSLWSYSMTVESEAVVESREE